MVASPTRSERRENTWLWRRAKGGGELSAKMLLRRLAPPTALSLRNSTALPCREAVPHSKDWSVLHATQHPSSEASTCRRGAGLAVLGSSRGEFQASAQQQGGREVAAVT